MTYKYHLCLGSNQGNKIGYLKSAKYLLEKISFKILDESSYYETEPVGMKENTETFINQVISGITELNQEDFLNITKDIERKIGRVSKGDYKDRVIDIDILLCNDLIINSENLNLPHPELHLRRFVLQPLCEIAPDLVHPAFRKSMKKLLLELEDDHSVKKMLILKSVY
jgi:2-amino-4-hydroxy-6-hydroxymethyldihydropteridine diphosphokinase